MDFDFDGKVAGSVASLLANEDVRRVFSVFGDECMEVYGVDVREKRSFMSAQVLRQVRSFVAEYGADDAVAIVEQAFAVPHLGSLNGSPIGTTIFSKGLRWYANALLLERGGVDGGKTGWEHGFSS